MMNEGSHTVLMLMLQNKQLTSHNQRLGLADPVNSSGGSGTVHMGLRDHPHVARNYLSVEGNLTPVVGFWSFTEMAGAIICT